MSAGGCIISTMRRDPFILPRTPVNELIEGLREQAVDAASGLEGIPAHEVLEGEAAQTLEEMHAALVRIAEGSPDPAKVATEALSLEAPLRPIGDAEDTIRGLLKPRRT